MPPLSPLGKKHSQKPLLPEEPGEAAGKGRCQEPLKPFKQGLHRFIARGIIHENVVQLTKDAHFMYYINFIGDESALINHSLIETISIVDSFFSVILFLLN